MTVGLAEHILRRVTDRPRRTPDYAEIDRLERALETERRAEERTEQRRIALEACAREGHLEPTDDAVEIHTWGSTVPIRLLPGCPRCGTPADNVPVEQADAAVRLRQAGIL